MQIYRSYGPIDRRVGNPVHLLQSRKQAPVFNPRVIGEWIVRAGSDHCCHAAMRITVDSRNSWTARVG